MTISRVLATSSLAALLALSLAACGDDEDDATGAPSAHTEACRTYELQGGGRVPALAEEVSAIIDDGSFEPAPLVASIERVRDAAALAGKVEGLAQKDYVLFRDVVSATEVLESGATSNGRAFEAADVQALRAADTAVLRSCD